MATIRGIVRWVLWRLQSLTVVPVCRIYAIPAEARILPIEAETRTWAIEAETRILPVRC